MSDRKSGKSEVGKGIGCSYGRLSLYISLVIFQIISSEENYQEN